VSFFSNDNPRFDTRRFYAACDVIPKEVVSAKAA
jgi:hypothetical protein